jgi:tetratricopeptide (TPR) repeat protein
MEKCATFDRRDVYIITQNALADGTYMNYIRDHYDFTRPNPDKPETIAKFTWWQQAIMRFAWKRMARDITYPKEPIHIPSPPEANDAFRQFVEDVQLGRIQAGADVRVENGRVSVEGVQGVMAINGILAKWIFEKNKDKHAFYVEESYVIPWMYPYLRPAGVIMKIEKEQLPPPQQDQKLWEQIITKDFAYWDQLLGEFIKRPEFKRDSDAQKAFSKLRCAIAGVYEYRGIVNAAEAAFSQAIAICPESPEASFRLANLYMRLNQAGKAVETLSKLAERDPFNKQVREALEQFRAIQNAMTPAQPPPFPIIRPK